MVNDELTRSGYLEKIGAGVVLTGGGSKLQGAIELAEEVFNMPVRIATPQYVSGLIDVVRNPIYSTGVGLLLFGHKEKSKKSARGPFEIDGNVYEKVKNWFHNSF